MMSIPVERYADPASLNEELERIFWRRCFVAHESDIPTPDSYLSFRLGLRNLTLRRFGSQAALLDNVCRHRFNLIDPPGVGIKPFRCGYHGWTYGPSGEVSFIPLRSAFGKNIPPLATHAVRVISGFFFKSIDSDNDGPFGELIHDIGSPAGTPFHRGSLHHRCNWKLLVENVLEGYHLSVVHPGTFGKSGFTSTSRSNSVVHDADSLLTTYPHERVATHLPVIFPGITPGYRHLFVFPNLFISVTNELVYFVSSLLPMSATETVLHYRLFASRRLATLNDAVQQHLKDEAIRFTMSALNEDKEVLENCQLGVESATGKYLLGDCEHRIEHFHAMYMRWI
jgi:phenylpropionate dioxygenase-like ring-hydroxylating dioxygenase large terminal subunit